MRVRVDHLGLLKPFSWMGSACKGDLGFGGGDGERGMQYQGPGRATFGFELGRMAGCGIITFRVVFTLVFQWHGMYR